MKFKPGETLKKSVEIEARASILLWMRAAYACRNRAQAYISFRVADQVGYLITPAINMTIARA